MADGMTCVPVGAAVVQQTLAGIPGKLLAAGALGITDGLNGVLADSRDLVPVLTGLLLQSGDVYDPVITQDRVTVTIGYGAGGPERYALRVHEDLAMNHAPGRTAKFLERPLLAWTRTGPTAVAERCRGSIG